MTHDSKPGMTITAAILLAVSCAPPKTVSTEVKKDKNVVKDSSTSPDSSNVATENGFQIQFPAISTIRSSNTSTPASGVISSYSIKVEPAFSSCTSATKFEETNPYVSTMISKSLARGCAYKIHVSILGMGGETLYRLTNPKNVTDNDLTAGRIPLILNLTASSDATSRGLPTSITTVTPSEISETVPPSNPLPGTTPTPAPSTNSNLGNILGKLFPGAFPQPSSPTPSPVTPSTPGGSSSFPSGKDLTLTTDGGGSTKLSQVLGNAQYLFVDLSQTGCPPCTASAEALNNDSSFATRFNGSKCSIAVIVQPSQLSDWKSSVGASSNVGRVSMGFSGGVSRFASSFGTSANSTPTFMLIDRSGNVKAGPSNSKDSVMSACR